MKKYLFLSIIILFSNISISQSIVYTTVPLMDTTLAESYCKFCDSLIELTERTKPHRIASLPTSLIYIGNRTFFQFTMIQISDITLYSFKETIHNQKEYTEVKIYLHKNQIFHIDRFYDSYLTDISDIYDMYCMYNRYVLQNLSRPGCKVSRINEVEEFQQQEYPIYEKLTELLFKL